MVSYANECESSEHHGNMHGRFEFPGTIKTQPLAVSDFSSTGMVSLISQGREVKESSWSIPYFTEPRDAKDSAEFKCLMHYSLVLYILKVNILMWW